LVLLLGACQPDSGELAGLVQQQQEIQERQNEVEQRLAKLERAARPQIPGLHEDPDEVHEIEVGESPVLGKPGAPVTIVEFADFQCPYCAGSAAVLKQVLAKYQGRVRLVYKHFPLSFHGRARSAARASLAAQEQGRFWEMHDLLFRHHQDLDEARFPVLAEKAGLDPNRFRRSYETHRTSHEKRVDSDYAQGLKVNVRGTPTIFVNGRKVRVRTLEGISAMIDEELRKASSGEEKRS
jgi:protein-disulfide isomerase